mgnify:CR=1 FL=1|jgi:hypothetical protein
MIMGGRTAPPVPKMPPPVPLPAKMDTPEIAEAVMDMGSDVAKKAVGKHRKYRVKGSKGKSTSHSKYKGGGLAGYTQKKAGNN